MAEPLPQESSPHQEIAELERLLEAKKQALEKEGKALAEREAFAETFRERFGPALSPPPAGGAQPGPAVLPSDQLSSHAAALKTKAREEQLESLVELAFTTGVAAAAAVARQATPWLMDELHDRLQDRYYDRLIAARKLKEW